MKILVIDDEIRVSEELEEYLTRKNYYVKTAHRPSMAFKILDEEDFDIVILDIKMPELSGLEVLKIIKGKFPAIEVIMISGHGDMDIVIEAMQSGAIDFLKKPFRIFEIQIAIQRTRKFVEQQKRLSLLEDSKSLLSGELEEMTGKELVGSSEAIRNTLSQALKAAEFPDVNVLITGESGTGKEIFARIIHYASPRASQKVFSVNCSAIPESLMESQFFGHEKGAFTGAVTTKKGFFELADRGTLFLDEIAEMPLNLQSKLLRTLEEKIITKVGSSAESNVDVRVISATHCNVENMIADKTFRLDLYHRLNVIKIHIPPLRERTEDIEPLVNHFVHNFARKTGKNIPDIPYRFIEDLKQYTFPGNVRELKNLVERTMILCEGKSLSSDLIPSNKDNTVVEEKPFKRMSFNLDENEKQLITEVLDETSGNQSKAAALLGISRHSLIRRLSKYDIK